MKRAFVFLLLAPASLFCTVVLLCTDAGGTKSLGFAFVAGIVLAALSLPMSAITAAVDGYLAHAFPISLRVCLTASVGAIIATGELLVLFSSLLSPSIVMGLALGAALLSAACSLLSHDYDGRQQSGFEPAGHKTAAMAANRAPEHPDQFDKPGSITCLRRFDQAVVPVVQTSFTDYNLKMFKLKA